MLACPRLVCDRTGVDRGLTGLRVKAILAFMKRVSVTELKNRLSHYLRLVKRGETIELLERKVPIARLSRVEVPSTKDEDLLLRLQRDGIITMPAGPPYMGFLKTPPVPCSVDVVRLLMEERDER